MQCHVVFARHKNPRTKHPTDQLQPKEREEDREPAGLDGLKITVSASISNQKQSVGKAGRQNQAAPRPKLIAVGQAEGEDAKAFLLVASRICDLCTNSDNTKRAYFEFRMPRSVRPRKLQTPSEWKRRTASRPGDHFTDSHTPSP